MRLVRVSDKHFNYIFNNTTIH